MVIIAEVFPFPPVGQAVVISIFIDRIMVAEVGHPVVIGKAAVLRCVGGHGLEFDQQIRIDVRGASVAVGAVGGEVITACAVGIVISHCTVLEIYARRIDNRGI